MSDGGGDRGVVPRLQELDLLLSKYVIFHMYVLKAVTGLGYLALTWSTVVLLGGFITALSKKDFWCITVISLMQALRIFQDLTDQLLPNFFKLVTDLIGHNWVVLRLEMRDVIEDVSHVTEPFIRTKGRLPRVASRVASVVFFGLTALPFLVLCYVPVFLYVYGGGPIACIGLAIWRTVQRDYGGDHDDSKANLAPALDIFYSLVLLQGGLFLVWLYLESWWIGHLILHRQVCKLPSTGWCSQSLVEFLCDTRARCWRDLSSIRGRKLVDYAVDLLDSGSWEDNLLGARLLAEFIGQGSDIRSLILPSRPKIQKLIDSLGWRKSRRTGVDREMRKLAACIVAHLAGDLHLSLFPGSTQCVSYLLEEEEITQAYSDQQQELTHHPHRRLAPEKQAMILALEKREGRDTNFDDLVHSLEADGGSSRGGRGACNELILQGLAILERLASNHHNCGEICSSPGLVAKLMAPLYSSTFIRDIGNTDLVQVANATFKVVYQLIKASGETSARLRVEISENKQAMGNLEAIIIREEAQLEELKMRGMVILTELALDSYIDLPRETKNTLMKKQMHIFLTGEGDLRATAGRTLVLILTKYGDENNLDPLVGILDDKNIRYRIIAAEILENMCVRCDKQRVKEILLPKVLSYIMSSERENTQSQNSALRIPAPAQDVENQTISTQRVNKGTPAPRDQHKSSDEGNEGQTASKALQAKLLSLILVMYVNKLETADFGNALQNNGSAFVAKLKTTVEENCEATVGSLSIVKLCGQIAVSMLQRNQYTEHFKNHEFVKSLSEARKIMSSLESCVLFAGRDHGLRKMAKPLLLDLEKEARKMVG